MAPRYTTNEPHEAAKGDGFLMKIAIVTGASSGLGREFVRQIAQRMPELREIWVIARREDRLLELREECPATVRPLAMDLAEEDSIRALEELLRRERPVVAVLVNAAGFGKIGDCRTVTRQDCDAMIDLNCRAAVDVTMACLPYMQWKGRILEICSTAAFQPFQHLNVYAASKAFLYRYSRALWTELFGQGITVTAVCPYWIKDTEFIPTAKQTDTGRSIRHFPLASRARSVVALALNDSALGLPVSTPGPVCLIHRIAAKFIPAQLMMGIWAILRRI